MSVTLITGLDGSGKSTLLSKIAQFKTNNSISTLLLPHIDTQYLDAGSNIFKAAVFINKLSYQADIKNIPQLKALALFASMLLYKVLLANLRAKTIFCERHPLIDTSIYAQFYAGKLAPGLVSEKVLRQIDTDFNFELTFLLHLLPVKQDTHSGLTAFFIDFIYKHFHLKKKSELADLQSLFGVELPDKIYYLNAAPELLFKRIKERKVHEAHESVAVFTMLNEAYHQLFKKLNIINPNLVEVIDANSSQSLHNFWELTIIKLIQN
jgi:thymidylate kinase